MGRQEGSPLFAESTVNYESRTSRGRKKLLIGAGTVGVAVLLTLAIAIPLSADQTIKPNSSSPLLGSKNGERISAAYEGESDGGYDLPAVQDESNGVLKHSRKRETKKPLFPSTTSSMTEKHESEDCDDDDHDDRHPKIPTKRPKWHSTTAREQSDDNPHDRPNPWWPTPTTEHDDEREESRDDEHRPKPPWWPRPTKKHDHTEDCDDSHGRRWPPRPRTRRPWWPRTTKKDRRDDDDDDDDAHPDSSSKAPWNPDDVLPPWYPKNYTRKPWWPWSTKKTTSVPSTTNPEIITSVPSTTNPEITTSFPYTTHTDITTSDPSTSNPEMTTSVHSTTRATEAPTSTSMATEHPTSEPHNKECQQIPKDLVTRMGIDNFANTWWYEQARVQSSEVPIPVDLISCSKGFFQIKKTLGYYTPAGASATFVYTDNAGKNETIKVDLWATSYFAQWLEVSEDKEIQLSFVSRSNDSLLTYECLPSKNSGAEYVVRVWSLEAKDITDASVESLLRLAESLGLNPEKNVFKEMDQTNC